MSYSVGQVADLAGVTIRTLHHYDEIGLLSPSGRSAAGYRIYEESDLERLQRILFYRELGFALEGIAAIVDDPRTDAVGHLRRQRGLLTERIKRLQEMVAIIDYEMEALEMDIKLTPEERLEAFGDFNPEAHAEEAEQRWGGTDAYRQSQRRVSNYTKEDWLKIKAEHDEVAANLAALFESGATPDSEEAMAAAEAHRQHISRWYYDCSPEIHRGLGDMYVSDRKLPRQLQWARSWPFGVHPGHGSRERRTRLGYLEQLGFNRPASRSVGRSPAEKGRLRSPLLRRQ